MDSNNVVKGWLDQLRRLERILGQFGPDEVSCEGLTQHQCAVLRTLAAHEGARICFLTAQARMTKAPMSRAIQTLQALGLVRRECDRRRDRRTAWVRITAKGRQTCKLLDDMTCQRIDAIVSAIPADQHAGLLNALQVINDAIEAASRPSNPLPGNSLGTLRRP